MTRIFLSTVAALAVGLSAAHAQSDRQERGGASAQPRAEDSRPAAQPGETQRAPQRAQSNERSPAGDRSSAGSGSAGKDSAQRPAESERSAGDTRDKASDRAGRNRDRSPRDAAGADRDRPSSRESSRSRDTDRDRSASEPQRDRAGDRASRRDRDARDRDATESRRSSETGRAERDRAASDRTDRSASTGRSARGEVSLSSEQRERVSARFASRIDSMNVRSVSRSSVSVSVGATIPSSVRLYPVPSDVIAIYPRFRGHQFVLVEDEIVIIEPRTRRIVTTIPRSGGGAVASRSSRSTTGAADAGDRIRLSPEQRRVIRTIVVQEPACRYEQRIDFFIGIPLPSTAKVCEFPERIVSEVPEVRRYRYMVRDEEVVLVDPDDERRVIEVIR